jgi:GNAT superfamily N-acetyltransferase
VPSIDRLTPESFDDSIKGLAEILTDAVEDGASLGFVTPFDFEDAAAWWRSQATAVSDGTLLVWTCRGPAGIEATASLHLPTKPNARHRAEVVKLMVRRDARGHGLARALLATVEEAATDAGISLLILDTETGSAAEALYLSEGWTRYGVVPDYAADTGGTLRDCTFFFLRLPRPTLIRQLRKAARASTQASG